MPTLTPRYKCPTPSCNPKRFVWSLPFSGFHSLYARPTDEDCSDPTSTRLGFEGVATDQPEAPTCPKCGTLAQWHDTCADCGKFGYVPYRYDDEPYCRTCYEGL